MTPAAALVRPAIVWALVALADWARAAGEQVLAAEAAVLQQAAAMAGILTHCLRNSKDQAVSF